MVVLKFNLGEAHSLPAVGPVTLMMELPFQGGD